MYLLRIACASCLLLAVATAQSTPAALQQLAAPESAFVSADQYTNAFFGFSMRKPPRDVPYQLLLVPSRASGRHSLFGLKVQRNGLTALTIDATESKDTSSDAVRETASGPEKQNVTMIPIGGRQFWKRESKKKGPEGEMRTLTYTTGINGYILRFTLISYDARLCDELRDSIESIAFFDPANAKEIAGPGSRPFDPPPPGASNTASPSQ
jgi:hypothetical protein